MNLMDKRKERVFVRWVRNVVARWKVGCSGAVALSSEAGPQGSPQPQARQLPQSHLTKMQPCRIRICKCAFHDGDYSIPIPQPLQENLEGQNPCCGTYPSDICQVSNRLHNKSNTE